MKRLLEITRLPMWKYKLAGAAVTAALLLAVHRIYYPTAPEYGNMPFYALVLFVVGLWLLLPYRLDRIAASVLMAAYSLYNVIQMVYYSQFSQFISLNGIVTQYSEASAYSYLLSSIVQRRDLLVLWLTALAIAILCLLRRTSGDCGRAQLAILLSAAMAVSAVTPYYLMKRQSGVLPHTDSSDPAYFESDAFLYDFMPSASVFVQKFGMEEFLIRDLEKNVMTHTDEQEERRRLVREFLSENTPYEENEETGIFRGKSLLLIQAESLTTIAVDPVLTPTLYQLEQDGWYFRNYHSPLLEGSTSTTELMANTSLLAPNDGNTPAVTYGSNAYPNSLPKGFAAAGYKVDAFHNNYANYYNRDHFFPAIGYEDFFDSYRLGVKNLESDRTCGRVIDWMDVADTVPYFSFWVTYSGHQDYADDFGNSEKYGPGCLAEYTSYLRTVKRTYPDLPEELQVYLAKNMSLDRAVRDYIDTFEAQGRDDIVIAVYGDHFAKEFSDESRKEFADLLGPNRTLNSTPLFLWTPGIEPRTIDKFCSSLDLMPTICNLFDIPYDRNAVFGNDIFDSRWPGFTFEIDMSLGGTGWSYSLSDHAYGEQPQENREAVDAMIHRFMKATYIATDLFQTDYFASDVCREEGSGSGG